MKKIIIVIALGSLIVINSIKAQDTTKSKVSFKVTTDLVSSYIWRGTIGSKNPNFQPTLAVVAGDLEIGVWGSSDFMGTYKEVDPYISYTIKSLIKITATDYDWNFIDPTGKSIPYFDYKNKTTGHIFEGSLAFLGTEKFPLSVSLNTMFYGADKKATDITKQNYSTYVELGYAFKKFSVFAGVTPWNGYYGSGYGVIDGFAVCNLGVSSQRTIKVSKDFELPIKGSVIVNPQAQNIHFVIGITL